MKSKSKPSFTKEVLERDVLARIRWDDNLDAADFTLTYSDRFSAKEKSVPVAEVSVDGDFMVMGDSTIPLHRIRKFLWRGEKVWDKRRIVNIPLCTKR
ncbi:MAG: DUF504 domain-containing protein [Candidatus Altiarchaeota archaeon]